MPTDSLNDIDRIAELAKKFIHADELIALASRVAELERRIEQALEEVALTAEEMDERISPVLTLAVARAAVGLHRICARLHGNADA